MKTTLFIALLAVASFSLSACNTVEGIGADVREAGETIERTF